MKYIPPENYPSRKEKPEMAINQVFRRTLLAQPPTPDPLLYNTFGTIIFCNLEKYFLQFGQIYFAIRTNTLFN